MTDHAAEVRSYLEEMEDDPKSPWTVKEGVPIALRHLNDLAAERDALLAYAQELEHALLTAEYVECAFGYEQHNDFDAEHRDWVRAKHNVAHLFD